MAGTTLLEILVAMLIIGLVSTGLITAFIFGRRMTLRSGTELSGANLVQETAEILRTAGQLALPPAGELSLAPGVYVDQRMRNEHPTRPNTPAFNFPASATSLAALNLPDDFARFQSDPGTGTSVALANHGDGRVVVVENAPVDTDVPLNGIQADELDLVDLDRDGRAGLDFNNDGTTELRRVRVRVKWTSPTT